MCIAQGSKHQGEIEGGGMQCSCIALAFCCMMFSNSLSQLIATRKPSEFLENTQQIMDMILEIGSKLYVWHINKEFCGQERYLLVDELPEFVTIQNIDYTIDRMEAFSGLTSTKESDYLSGTLNVKDALSQAFENTPYCLMTIGYSNQSAEPGYTSALVKTESGKYLYFDSHSRSTDGLCAAENGTAVLIQFGTVDEFSCYIGELTMSVFSQVDLTSYEIVPIKINRE